MYIIDKLFFVIKRFIFSVLIIYTYNMIIFPTGNVISMNLFSIMIIMFLGFPGVIGLGIFSLFVL